LIRRLREGRRPHQQDGNRSCYRDSRHAPLPFPYSLSSSDRSAFLDLPPDSLRLVGGPCGEKQGEASGDAELGSLGIVFDTLQLQSSLSTTKKTRLAKDNGIRIA
jgi:hypothetical protein